MWWISDQTWLSWFGVFWTAWVGTAFALLILGTYGVLIYHELRPSSSAGDKDKGRARVCQVSSQRQPAKVK